MKLVGRGLKPRQQWDELAAIDRGSDDEREGLNHAEAGETSGKVGLLSSTRTTCRAGTIADRARRARFDVLVLR